MKLKLLEDRVLLEAAEEVTGSGLILSKNEDASQLKEGTVVAYGPGRVVDDVIQTLTVKLGDKVLFQFASDVIIEGKKYKLCRESDLALIFEK